MDPIFQELQIFHFSNPSPSRSSRSRPASPPPKQATSPICQALTLHGTILPVVINFQQVTHQMANNPWGAAVGPLNLAAIIISLKGGGMYYPSLVEMVKFHLMNI